MAQPLAQESGMNVALAFGVCAMAGLATSLGAAVPFFHKIQPSDKRILAIALSLSSGVMTFVSFTEILQVKAVEGFLAHYSCVRDTHPLEEYAKCYRDYYGLSLAWSYGLFFCGIGLCCFLDAIIHLLTHSDHSAHGDLIEDIFVRECSTSPTAAEHEVAGNRAVELCEDGDSPREQNGESPDKQTDEISPAARAELQRMGLISGFALALHNVPEGIATFVATLAQGKVGIALGFAVAVHNIPEGVTVAMPIYYATGSRWKAFMWATLSGCAEILGGIIGYAIVGPNSEDPLPMAVLFSLVSGMMIFIVVAELLPTAFKYDDSGKCVIGGFCLGMFIMALSLVLFSV